MSIERFKTMKEQLMSCAESQMHNLKEVNAEELGEVIDMIKDLEEAIYYCTITKAMEENDKGNKEERSTNNNYYYPMTYPRYYEPEIYYRDMDRENGYMYYDMPHIRKMMDTPYNGHGYQMIETRDPKEGRSYAKRKMYMEGKESHRDIPAQMKELEEYLQELSTDVTEMINGASAEEKNLLRQKLNTLIGKIA